jgi:hypothetical protein
MICCSRDNAKSPSLVPAAATVWIKAQITVICCKRIYDR